MANYLQVSNAPVKSRRTCVMISSSLVTSGAAMVSPRLVAKIESEEPTLRLAVLIDADNAQAAVIEGILGEVARFGEASVKRIYGDFTSPNSSSWKKVLQKYAIKPVQQFAYTTGKNATDSTLIIDAMDLLYTRRLDGFCLITSDSDFTGLATRIREEGLLVLGFGEQKTPDAFRNACNKFILTEVLRRPPSEEEVALTKSDATPAVESKASPTEVTQLVFPKEFVLSALEQSSDETGWAHMGTFGSYLTKLQPDFDSRVYGFKKLSDLVKAKTDLFVTEERLPPGGQTQKQLYLRAK
ncbi:HTH OST-type domain-containing protein [Thauera humireducens]|uniref:NYN domain-containing protein n=1 Tax=Thauera humireducens TaxID=1134435 RepID=UPI002467A2C4|nr:NYN domain-containing protein [Thauera humireducens]CAH1748238.1 HTH OST-type domain-containing protein [Thauera humireducens]